MAWFKSNKEKIKIANILKGTTDPVSSIGDNGQLYLKYYDYSNDYSFREYLEVTSSGPYINTEVNCTSNAYFEVDFNFTGSHSESRVFGCGTGGGAMFLIQNYNFDYMSVGATSISDVYQIPDASNRHKYKANADGIYVDDVLVDTNVQWNNALPQRHYNLFAIDWDGTAYYATNTRVYSCRIWNGTQVIRYFIPAMRKSDDAIGMFDIVNGIFYTNDGSGSFTISTTEKDMGNIIVDSFAKVNGQWQGLIGTDVDNILAGGSKYIKATGSFTSGTESQQKVEVNCGFKPDLVMVDMEFGDGFTRATYLSTAWYEETDHPISVWDLRPMESVIYAITPESVEGETGITDLTSTGFKYRVNGYNTQGKACTYTAIKFDVEEQSSIAFEKYFATDTGILLPLERKPSTDKIEIEFYNVTTRTYSGIVGNSNSTGTNAIPLWINSNSRLQFYSYAMNTYTLTTGAHKFTYDPTDSSIVIDDAEIGSGLSITSVAGGYYALGASMPISSGVAANMYIGRFKVTDISTGNVRCDYTPCIKDGISYIYDYVTKSLLGSNRIASIDITSGKRISLETKSTGGYDAAITVSLYKGNTLIETHDVLYTDVPDLNHAYELGCIKLYYASTWQLRASKVCAWANTSGNVKPYYPLDNITSWAYNSSVDYEVMFDE